MSGCELLRHFWLCFPPTTPQLQEKAEKMHEALHRFHSAKLKPFEVQYCNLTTPLYFNLILFFRFDNYLWYFICILLNDPYGTVNIKKYYKLSCHNLS